MTNFVLILLIAIGLSMVGIGLKLTRMFTLFRPHIDAVKGLSIDQLPSVTLCIPARNETHAMTECLERALASNYPKLEIIVLDDGSRDDTSILIKSFAHAGIRFVEGNKLPEGWLGKNHALYGLVQQASGSYVLFADVDTRFSPDTINQFVEYAIHEQADMISVLPMRADSYRTSVLFTTLRQFWSVLFHKPHQPAVASNAWMVKRSMIVDMFTNVEEIKTAIRPEVVVARQIVRQGRYRFLISSAALGLTYEKKWTSQVETSVRLAYPLLGQSWIKSIATCLLLLLFLLPYVSLLVGIIIVNTTFVLVSFATVGMEMIIYSYYLTQIHQRAKFVSSFLLPAILVQEITLIVVSAVKYSRGTVTWKGRPVFITSK